MTLQLHLGAFFAGLHHAATHETNTYSIVPVDCLNDFSQVLPRWRRWKPPAEMPWRAGESRRGDDSGTHDGGNDSWHSADVEAEKATKRNRVGENELDIKRTYFLFYRCNVIHSVDFR